MTLRLLLILGLTLAVPMALAPTPAVAQFEIKTCSKCKEKSITSKPNCLKCGTPFAGAPASAKAKSKAKPAKAKPAEPAKPAAVTKSKGKAAPIVAKPEPPSKVAVTVELPSNPYETGLTTLSVKAIARGVKVGTKVALWTTADGALAGKQTKLAEQVAERDTVALVGALKLDKAGVKQQVIAVAVLAAGTWVSQPITVSRFAQTLPKPASAEAFEAYLVEVSGERKLDPADPALGVGTHRVKYYAPSKAQPTAMSAAVEVNVGAAGRASSASLQVALAPLAGTLTVTVTRTGAPATNATVEIVSASDATKKFAQASNATGLAAFTDVPAGTYRIIVNGKPRQDVTVAAGATATAAVALKLTTLAVTIFLDGNVAPLELSAIGPTGKVVRLLNNKRAEVTAGTYRLALDERATAVIQFVTPAEQTVAVSDEEIVDHRVRLQSLKGTVVVRVSDEDAPYPTRIELVAQEPISGLPLRHSGMTTVRDNQLWQTIMKVAPGIYTVTVSDEWQPATVKVLVDATTEVTLRRLRGPVTIALGNTSLEERQFNEADLRFTLRDEAGKTTTVRAGTLTLPRGSYTVTIDAATIPRDWKLVTPAAPMNARVPGISEVRFTLAPLPKAPVATMVTVTKLIPKLKYLVSINARPATFMTANDKGELAFTVPPGESDLAVAAVDFEYVEFYAKLNTSQSTTVAAAFPARLDGEIVSAKSERLVPKNVRVTAVFDYPADADWTAQLRSRGVALPKRVELAPSKDGRLALPASLGLPPAPYRVTLSWQEDEAGTRTKIGNNGRQDVVFDVTKKAVSARGEVVWKTVGK